MGVEEMKNPLLSEENICNCGTKVDAYTTALNVMEEMVDKNCPIWALQVACALQQISLVVSASVILEKPSSKGNLDLQKDLGEAMTEAIKGNKELEGRVTNIARAIASKSMQSISPTDAIDFLETMLRKGK